MDEFKKLGLSDETIDVLIKKGFTEPSPIQEKTIPILLKGDHDVVGRANTGTGKTACFALPILENLVESKNVQALILTPTRELAVQVTNEIRSLSGDRRVRVTTIYGGTSIRNQINELRRGIDIVVGTPGRVMDLMDRKVLDISNISYAVLDEADEMLNMGFVDDMKEILKQTNSDKKMLMFSATMPKEILRIAERFMREYEMITVEETSLAVDLVDQVYFDIKGKDRYAAIRRIVVAMPEFYGIIFCKTKIEVDALAHKLVGDNYPAAALHGDISQAQRENILRQFKNKRIKILIATDVAARGIDVNDLTVVINHSLPQTPELYIHRIGRTGRMGNRGNAITFLIPSERRGLKPIERLINQKIPKGELPTIQSTINSKKEQIESVIRELLESKKYNEYTEVAERLVRGNNPEKVIACVLQYAFKNELDSESYKDIETISGKDRADGGDRRSRRGRKGRGRGRGRKRYSDKRKSYDKKKGSSKRNKSDRDYSNKRKDSVKTSESKRKSKSSGNESDNRGSSDGKDTHSNNQSKYFKPGNRQEKRRKSKRR